jgi:hypothetical protein
MTPAMIWLVSELEAGHVWLTRAKYRLAGYAVVGLLLSLTMVIGHELQAEHLSGQLALAGSVLFQSLYSLKFPN